MIGLSIFGLWALASLSPCEVVDSQQDIPHVRTTTALQAMTCAGYHQGRDRADQLIYLRSAIRGQMAERFGADYIKYDVLFRLLRLPLMAQKLIPGFSTELRASFQAFAQGVEQGMAEAQSLDRISFATSPLKWTAEDSLGLLLLQSFYQTKRGFESQLKVLRAQEQIPEISQHLDFFDDVHTPWRTSVIKENEIKSPKSTSQKVNIEPLSQEALLTIDGLLETLEGMPRMAHGSNNFVISGKRTKSGYPILENDPHLEIQNPPFWYWIDLENQEWRVLGAMVPGVPLFALGFNGALAWGLTNSFYQATSLRLLPESLTELESQRPLIWFKFGFLQLPFFFKTLSWTNEGIPLWPQSLELNDKKYSALLYWSGFKIDSAAFEGIIQMPKLKTVTAFDRTAQAMQIPSWHYVFADTKGSIGYRMVGRLPRYLKDTPGRIPTENFAHEEILAPEDLPRLINPERGFIVSANNPPWPANYPLKSGWTHEPSFRAYRIEELLQTKPRWALHDATAIACDKQMIDSRFLIPLLKPWARGRLTDSTLTADLHCTECSFYGIWISHIRDKTGLGEAPLFQLLSLKEPPASLIQKIKDSFDETEQILGSFDSQHLNPWQKFHQVSVRWLGLASDTYQTLIATTGGQHSVNLGEAKWLKVENRFQQTYGPSSRFLIELSTPPKILLSLPGRNRRQRDEPFANDHLTKKWQRCEFDSYQWK